MGRLLLYCSISWRVAHHCRGPVLISQSAPYISRADVEGRRKNTAHEAVGRKMGNDKALKGRKNGSKIRKPLSQTAWRRTEDCSHGPCRKSDRQRPD